MDCLCRKAGTTEGGSAARHVWKFDQNEAMLAVFGLENQTREDPHMVFQVMGYDYGSYRYRNSSAMPFII